MDARCNGSDRTNQAGTDSSNASNTPERKTSPREDGFVHDWGADTGLRRTLSTRHVTMITLGSSIGMGLWLGSGFILFAGGPVAMFIGFLLAGLMVWSVAHSIGELAVMYPLPSGYVQWTAKFVDPAMAFAVGWGYYFAFCVLLANELQAANTVMRFWTDEVHVAAWIVIWWVVIVLVNIGAVRFFAEIEVVCSTIKFSWIFVVIVSLIVISAGGGPNNDAVGFRYWNSQPFTNDFKGFLAVLPFCIFTMAGTENAAMIAAETANPLRSIPRAVRSIWIRLAFFYILGSFVVSINVNPQDPNLFGAPGTNASPFVIAYRNAGVRPLAHIMNAVILISVVSMGSITCYAAARTVMGLAYLGMAPAVFKKTDKMGRPWFGLLPVFVIGLGLGFLNVTNDASKVFSWFANLSSLIVLFGWGSICLSHLRFRRAWKVQGRAVENLPWRTWTFPVAAWFGLAMCIVLLIIMFYLSVWPLGIEPNAKDFWASYVSVPLVLAAYVIGKVIFRTPKWVNLDTVDLDLGRRYYADEMAHRKSRSIFTRVLKAFVS